MKRNGLLLIALCALCVASDAQAYVAVETNAVVRDIVTSMTCWRPDRADQGRPPAVGREKSSSSQLARLAVDDAGLDIASRERALADYLSFMETADMKSMDVVDIVRFIAVVQWCGGQGYTNACKSLCAISFNPQGCCRSRVICAAIGLGGVSDEMTEYVRRIVEDDAFKDLHEDRQNAAISYSKEVQKAFDRPDVDRQTLTKAVALLFSHRDKFTRTLALDAMFCKCVAGYANSVSRLAYLRVIKDNAREWKVLDRHASDIMDGLIDLSGPVETVRLVER